MQERVIDRVEVYKLGGDSFLYFDGGEKNVLWKQNIKTKRIEMETYCLKELYNEIKVIYVKRYTYISTIIQFLSSFSVQLYITIYLTLNLSSTSVVK